MRIVARLLVLLPLLWVEGVRAFECPSRFYSLTTQAQVDALGATGCSHIRGNLEIRDSSDITNLDALTNITSLGGHLWIGDNSSLTNVHGLANLTSPNPVYGSNIDFVRVEMNPALVALHGLENINSVEAFVRIIENDALTNVDGLANLASLGVDLGVIGNDALTNLDGLSKLSSIGGYTGRDDGSISIYGNDALTNLDGLAGLARLGGYLSISLNNALANLDGLSNLTSVGSFMYVQENPSLANVDGLAKLSRVGGLLTIRSNDALGNLDGLAGLLSVGDHLIIEGNDTIADVNGLTSLTSVGDYLHIRSNAALTNLDGLSNLSTLAGDLYIENNSALISIDGLANITPNGEVWISRNAALTNLDGLANANAVGKLLIELNDALSNLDGLANISSVGGEMYIVGNPSLTNLDGLVNISGVETRLTINGNQRLMNVDGLVNLTSVGENLEVRSNAALAHCEGLTPILGWTSGPPDDGVTGEITIINNGTGCNSVGEVLASVSGPTQPVITESTTSSNSLSLGFTPSTTTDDLFPITGYSASCNGREISVSGSPTTDLLDNTPIQETLAIAGYDPTSVLSSIEVDIDITHSDPTDLHITLTSPKGTEVILWNQGSASGEDLVGTFPTSLPPVDSFETISSESMDGEWVLRVEDLDAGPLVREGVLNSWGLRITEEVTASGVSSPIEVTGITRGREYQCRVAPVTKLGKVPKSEPFIVNPSATTVFNQLLDTVLSTTQTSDVGSAVDRSESRPPQARVEEKDATKAIPTLPTFVLFILSGLIGLFGIRRFAQQ